MKRLNIPTHLLESVSAEVLYDVDQELANHVFSQIQHPLEQRVYNTVRDVIKSETEDRPTKQPKT